MKKVANGNGNSNRKRFFKTSVMLGAGKMALQVRAFTVKPEKPVFCPLVV